MAADVSSPTLARAAGRRYGYLPRRDEAPNDQRNNRYQADSDGLGPPRIGIPHGEAQVRESETPSSSTRGNAKSSGEVGLPTRMVPGGPHRGGIAAYQRQPALDPADFRSTPSARHLTYRLKKQLQFFARWRLRLPFAEVFAEDLRKPSSVNPGDFGKGRLSDVEFVVRCLPDYPRTLTDRLGRRPPFRLRQEEACGAGHTFPTGVPTGYGAPESPTDRGRPSCAGSRCDVAPATTPRWGD